MPPQPLDIQHWVDRMANICVAGSTLRGARREGGKVTQIRSTLRKFRLSDLNKYNYSRRLNALTDQINRHLSGEYWGISRKIANTFLRECLYNYQIREKYNLSEIEPFAEIPLDRFSMEWLITNGSSQMQLAIKPISRLTKADNARFQKRASSIARQRGIARIDLDLLGWKK